MPDKIIHVDHIGDVTFRKNKRSKSISISIRPIKGVVVNFPCFVSYKYALSVVRNKQEWILSHLPKIQQIENKATIFAENTRFNTRSKEYIFKKEPIDKFKAKISSDRVIFSYPEHVDIKNKEVQYTIKELVIKSLRAEAKNYLPLRAFELAQKYKFRYNKVFVKNTKTLWGSCSAKNNINLNLHLIRLPNHLIDYVIIHELCHTVEKNHGKHFWKLMDSILGNAKLLSKELKTYSIQIY